MPSNSQKGFISFLTVMLFIILIGSFAGAVVYFRQQPINQELPRQVRQETPAPTPALGPIEVYKHPTLGFSFEYPKGWKIKEVMVQNNKTLKTILEISPADYVGAVVPFKLLSVDNPNKLELSELDLKLYGKEDAGILYSVDDLYMLTGSGLAVNFRNGGECEKKKCQIYTFSRDTKVYQLVSFLAANIFEQRQIFDRMINSFKFDDFTQPERLGASTSASPR